MRSYVAVAGAVAWRHLNNLVKNPALFLPPLVFPLFFFAAFAGGLSAVGDAPGFDYPDYTAFQFVFVLLQTAAFGGVFTGFSIAADWESGFARRMMLAAEHRSALIAGYTVAAAVRTVVVGGVVFLVALATGMEIGGNGIEMSGLVLLALIVNVAATLFGAGVSLRFRTMQAAPALQTPVFLFLFLAPVYTPRDLLAGWIHSVANVNPATALLEAGRGLVSGLPAETGLAFAAALGLALLFAVWAVRGMRSAENAA
ncbi:MAG TPA: ABC transporter permease [Thermoleophilaceae bacterium]|nr:ABC transporter permease [Thermoleophilaceae bacterium]